jgi:hypothetical protein
VTLVVAGDAADIRALREQALLAQLGPAQGVIGTIRNVGARGRIIDALDARAQGEEGRSTTTTRRALDEYLADVPAPSAETIAKARGDASTRREDAARAVRHPRRTRSRARTARGRAGEGDPSVRVELGSARR